MLHYGFITLMTSEGDKRCLTFKGNNLPSTFCDYVIGYDQVWEKDFVYVKLIPT